MNTVKPWLRLKPTQIHENQRLILHMSSMLQMGHDGNIDRAEDEEAVCDEADEEANWCRMAGMQRLWNNTLVEMNRLPCRSISTLHVFEDIHARPKHFCNHQLCPSCWYNTRMNVISHLNTFTDDAYWYIRYSDPIEYSDVMAPELWTRFRGDGSAFTLLGYDVQLGAERFEPIGEGWDEGEMFQRLIGVFVARKEVQHAWIPWTNNRKLSYVDFPQTRLNTIHSPKNDVIDMYAGLARMPGVLYRHPRFLDYIERFAPRRSWTGSKNPYGQMFKTVTPRWIARVPSALESTIPA